jgi:hypothetical protein
VLCGALCRLQPGPGRVNLLYLIDSCLKQQNQLRTSGNPIHTQVSGCDFSCSVCVTCRLGSGGNGSRGIRLLLGRLSFLAVSALLPPALGVTQQQQRLSRHTVLTHRAKARESTALTGEV